METKRILFATDFSERSAKAVSYAVDTAKCYGAKLYIVHVIQNLEEMTKWYVPKISFDEVYKAMEARALTELGKYCGEGVGTYENIECKLLKGIPHEEILKFHEENNIELLILGSHGSTADRIAKDAQCPVLTVVPRADVPESTSMNLCSGGNEIRL